MNPLQSEIPKSILVRNVFSSTLDNYVAIDSTQCKQLNNTYSEFQVNLASPLIGVSTFKLLSLKIQSGILYNMNTTFVLQEQSQADVVISMPQGIYTASNISALLKAQLDLASPSGSTYTVTLDPFTARMTIVSSTTPFRFAAEVGSTVITTKNHSLVNIGWVGVYPQQPLDAYALSQTGRVSINLSPYASSNIFVEIWGTDMSDNNNSGDLQPFTFVIDGDNLSRTINGFSSNTQYHQSAKVNAGYSMSQFNVRLTDQYGVPLVLQSGVTLVIGWNK